MIKSTEQQGQLLTWPDMATVIGNNRFKSRFERIKYQCRYVLSKPYQSLLLDCLSRLPHWLTLFTQTPKHYHSAMSHFLDRRWLVRHRFEVVCNDLLTAHQKFGELFAQQLVSHKEFVLFDRPDSYRIVLSLNPINLQKGHWALALMDVQNERICSLSFGFVNPTTALIASTQGGKLKEDGSMIAAIQKITKDSYGLRPANILLVAFQALCQTWHIDEIWGIDPKHHIKGRWNQRSKRLKFDYRSFWSEVGSQYNAQGYWSIPQCAAA